MTKKDMSLTIAQHNRLDGIADEDPGAKVIAWDDRGVGPVVRFSDGRKSVVGPDSRLRSRGRVDADDIAA